MDIATGVNAADKVSKWTSQQVLTIIAVISLVSTNGLLVWALVTSQKNRLSERESNINRDQLLMRHCADESRLQRESNEALHRETTRVISELSAKIGRLTQKD